MSHGASAAVRKAHVWYDAKGEILAVGHVPEPAAVPSRAAARRTVVPLAAPGHSVIELDVAAGDLERLHETHCIDIHKKTLVRRGMPGS